MLSQVTLRALFTVVSFSLSPASVSASDLDSRVAKRVETGSSIICDSKECTSGIELYSLPPQGPLLFTLKKRLRVFHHKAPDQQIIHSSRKNSQTHSIVSILDLNGRFKRNETIIKLANKLKTGRYRIFIQKSQKEDLNDGIQIDLSFFTPEGNHYTVSVQKSTFTEASTEALKGTLDAPLEGGPSQELGFPLLEERALTLMKELGFDSEESAIDLLTTCYGKGLGCALYTREENDRTEVVFLVGEDHQQKFSTYQQAVRMLRHFKTLGTERIGLYSLLNPGVFELTDGLEATLFEAHPPDCSSHSLVNELNHFKPEGTRVYNLENGGPLFEGGLNFACTVVGGCFKLMSHLVSDPDSKQVFSNFGTTFLSAGVILTAKNVKEAITGEFRQSNVDNVMGTNLSKILKAPNDRRILGVVGGTHLDGIGENLTQRNRFVDRAEDLNRLYWYFKEKSPVALQETEFRDLRHSRLRKSYIPDLEIAEEILRAQARNEPIDVEDLESRITVNISPDEILKLPEILRRTF